MAATSRLRSRTRPAAGSETASTAKARWNPLSSDEQTSVTGWLNYTDIPYCERSKRRRKTGWMIAHGTHPDQSGNRSAIDDQPLTMVIIRIGNEA